MKKSNCLQTIIVCVKNQIPMTADKFPEKVIDKKDFDRGDIAFCMSPDFDVINQPINLQNKLKQINQCKKGAKVGKSLPPT